MTPLITPRLIILSYYYQPQKEVHMKFEKPLREGQFLKRYKRFFTDIEFEGETITAHCPNTGSMKGLKDEGSPCLFSSHDDPNRKLKHTLEMIKVPKTWVGVNTSIPNKLAKELFETNPLPHWKEFNRCQSEVKISDASRIDLVLWNEKKHSIEKWNAKNLKAPLHLIEIKNVTLGEDGVAYFPDAVTSRGLKHLEEMILLTKKGFTCEMLYVIQREDCKSFKTADDIDPEYGKKLKEAAKKGVRVTPLVCKLTKSEVKLTHTQLDWLQ